MEKKKRREKKVGVGEMEKKIKDLLHSTPTCSPFVYKG